MKAKTTVRKQGYFSRVHKLGENYCDSPEIKEEKKQFYQFSKETKNYEVFNF